MTKIYLIRHAEAEGNVYRRIHGQYDSRVTPNGLHQIAALEKRFENVAVDACYASDLNRTCVTARAIYQPKGLQLRTDARLRELNLGRWEDIPFGWLERYEPERMRQFNHEREAWSVEGGESYAECSKRAFAALRDAAEENEGKVIAVVTHGCVLRSLQSALTGDVPYCDNTAVSLLNYEDGEFQVEFLNDSSHLSEEISTFARQKWWRSDGDRRDFNMWFETEGMQTRAILRDEEVGSLRLSTRACAPEELRIEWMQLDAAHCGRGLGEQLLGQAVSTARSSHCDVLVAEVPTCARPFFERVGFTACTEKNGQDMKLRIVVPQE